MQHLDPVELVLKRSARRLGNHGDPILPRLPSSHDQLPPLQVDVLNPKRQALRQAESTPIQQQPYQTVRTSKQSQDSPHLLGGHHHR